MNNINDIEKHLLGLMPWFLDKYIDLIPELAELYTCEQNPEHHPEGNAGIHTELVIKEAFKYRNELPKGWKKPFMWAILLHDIGKPETCDPKTLTCYSHDVAGARIAKTILRRFTEDELFITKVINIIRTHMRGRQLIKQKSSLKAWRKTEAICPLEILAYVTMCDNDGRAVEKEGKEGNFKDIMDKLEELRSSNE